MRKGSPIQVAEAHQTEYQQPIRKKEETTFHVDDMKWRKESLKWRDTWETKLWKETPI